MEIYKEAVKQKIRVQTPRGPLSAEELYGLSLKELDVLAVSLEEAYNNSKGKSFLDKKSEKDEKLKLQFQLVLDVLETKKEEQDALQKSREDKEHNERILELISEKQDEALKGKSVSQLKAMLR